MSPAAIITVSLLVTWLPAMWLAVVLGWGWVRRPPARLLALRPAAAPSTFDPRLRRLLAPAVAVLVALVVWPLLAPVVVAVTWGVDVGRRRREVRRAEEAVVSSLPEAVDLLALAVGSGLTVALAVAAVGRRGVGPVARGLARASAESAAGVRCADALDDLPRTLGETVRPLVSVLVAADRYGAPLAPSLERLAAEVRADHRRRAEEAARRVPIKLLFPLVSCVLPAFGLLTVVPMLAGAFQALRP